MALKKYILFFAVLFTVITVKAQSGYNYSEWGAGADISWIRGYTNITKQFDHPAVALKAVYNYNPYLPIEAEIQVGTLSGGGNTVDLDPYGRQYTNNYKAIVVHVDVQLGAAIDYSDSWILNIMKNFYGGAGLGLISNTNTVNRYSPNAPPYPMPGYYKFPGNDNSIDLMVALRGGYEFKIFNGYNEPNMAIDVGYIHNVAFGEGLDGYNDPSSKFKNNAFDQYRQIVVGFKYFFGRVVSYNKLIRTPR